MKENPTQRFAVFGDTHGHLRLMFRLCQLWQQNNQMHLDGIFQCGDLGYFPNPEYMGILSWTDKHNHHFTLVDDDWFTELNSLNWWSP